MSRAADDNILLGALILTCSTLCSRWNERPSRNSRAMRNIATTCLGRAILSLAFLAASCGKPNDQPPASYAPPQALPSQPPGADARTSADGTTPALAAAPAAPGVPSAALSTPNPLALGCTTDAHCLTHRCNVAAQKCAWPCQTDNDCMPGNACVAPTCLPKLK
jgi:hypothetical protein